MAQCQEREKRRHFLQNQESSAGKSQNKQRVQGGGTWRICNSAADWNYSLNLQNLVIVKVKLWFSASNYLFGPLPNSGVYSRQITVRRMTDAESREETCPGRHRTWCWAATWWWFFTRKDTSALHADLSEDNPGNNGSLMPAGTHSSYQQTCWLSQHCHGYFRPLLLARLLMQFSEEVLLQCRWRHS